MGQPLVGFAALCHVYQRFKLDRGQAMCIDLSGLVQLSFQGDLEGFLAAGDCILMSLGKQPVEEMLLAHTSERQGRLIDHDQSGSMEEKKREGYF